MQARTGACRRSSVIEDGHARDERQHCRHRWIEEKCGSNGDDRDECYAFYYRAGERADMRENRIALHHNDRCIASKRINRYLPGCLKKTFPVIPGFVVIPRMDLRGIFLLPDGQHHGT